MCALLAKKPEIKEKRLKMFLFGPPGSRKTTSALQFPNAVLIDMEKGSEQYNKTIEKAKSVVLKTTNPDDVLSEIKSLLTEKHEYKTLIIDPVTIFYQSLQEKWTRIFEQYAKTEKEKQLQDFGMRYWSRVKSEYKSFLRMLMQLDLNLIITSHQKDIYGPNMQKVGIGPDSMKGDEYVFDYVFRLGIRNDTAIAITEKQRSEPLEPQRFPHEFEWSYANFLKFYGKDIIEKEAVPVSMADKKQIEKIKQLTDVVKISDDEITKWWNKADVDCWDEMTSDQIEKCIKFVSKKLDSLSQEEQEEKPKKKGK